MCQVPEYLIKCINEGKATLSTTVLGGGGAYSIPVPENKYIVIYGFRWNHFLNWKEAFEADPTLIRKFVNKALVFQSGQKQFRYNFRTLFNINFAQLGHGMDLFIISQPEQIATYQIHEDDVNISIILHPAVESWSFTFGQVTTQTNSRIKPVPFGYGRGASGLNTTLRIAEDFATFPEWRTSPLGVKTEPGGGFTNDLFPPADKNTSLPVLVKEKTVDAQMQFPMLDIYYCIFDKNPTSKQRP